MKKLLLLAVLMAGTAAAGLFPQMVTITNRVTDTVSAVSTNVYPAGGSLFFSSCVLMTTTNTRQDVTNLTVKVAIGTHETNTIYTATTDPAQSNWWCVATIPAWLTDRETCFVQVTVSDSNGVSVVYPLKTVNFTQGL